MMSFGEFSKQLSYASVICKERLEIIVAAAAQGGAEYAKDIVGHQQKSWDRLAPRTIQDKRALGFRAPDYEPLLRTGEMRDSIQGASDGLTGIIGSNDPVLRWQEHGTNRGIPPRPVTPLAVMEFVMPFLDVECEALAKTLLGVGDR